MAFDGVSTESLSEMTVETKAAVFLIAFEMEQNEKEDKTSNANVSSNNSLESDDIHNELQMSNDFVPKMLESDGKQQAMHNVEIKSLKSLAAHILNGKSHSPVSKPGTSTCTENGNIAVVQRPESMLENEDLYLPRSALISTSTGLTAKEHMDGAYGGSYIEAEQCNEAAAYMVPVKDDSRVSENSTAIESTAVEAVAYPANQLYYDDTGLAYTYDGYQFYAAQAQPYYTEIDQTCQMDPQPQCLLTQCGETTYVNYVPQNYMMPSQDLLNTTQEYGAVGYSQMTHFPPSEYTEPMQFEPIGSTMAYEQRLPENVPNIEESMHTTEFRSQSMVNEEWSTNDDSENAMKANEPESGKVIVIEPLDDQGQASNSYNETMGGFRPPKVEDGVPVIADGLMKIENKSLDDIPTDCPFPSLFVSDNGLITVLLRNGICLEMTPKRDLRLVNHSKKLVAATNDRGSSSIMIHPALKLVQSGTTTELDLFLARKAKMKTESITFGNRFGSYKFDYKKIVEEMCPMFRDLTEDESVDFLFSHRSKRKKDLVTECIEKSIEAHFDYFSNGGFKVFINGVKVVQTSKGDVYVTNGPKNLRMSATSSRLGIQTHFIEASVEPNWNVKVKRGTHILNASHLGFVVSNGHIEAAFDDRNRLQVVRLPDRVPLRFGQYRQRRPGVHRRRYPYRDPEFDNDVEMTSRRYR